MNPVSRLIARFSSPKEAERLRAIGTSVLALGIAGACVFYWIEARAAARSMNNVLPGYSRAQEHEIGMLMGHTGLIMLEWQEALDRPDTQAILIAAVAGLFALGFFRAARLLDEDEHARAQSRRDG